MLVTVDIPEDLASRLAAEDLPQRMLEALLIEEFRRGTLTKSELRRLLGLSRLELDGFLKARAVYIPYTIEDLERERSVARRLGLYNWECAS
jgi:hypothetical protein